MALDPVRLVPCVINVDDADSPADMIDALSLAAFTAGTQPHANAARLDEVRADASLLPPGAVIVRTARDQWREALLGSGPGWTIRVSRWRGGGTDVSVTAETAGLATEVLQQATTDATPPSEPDAGIVSMGFWHQSARRGCVRSARQVTAEPWAAIQALSRLLNLTDGILGQGRKVLVAITTNEDLHRLHPAVTRPGRCLAQVEVGPFPPAEAAHWLRASGQGHQNVAFASPVTLAELYALRSGRKDAADIYRAPEAVGQYL